MPPALLPVAAALEHVLGVTPRLGSEEVPVMAALGRVLREDVHAAGDTPPFACSAMDGYAIQPGPAGRELIIVDEARAGTPAAAALSPGHAIRISTGAPVPEGAGAVIRQEDTETRAGRVLVTAATRPGENIRGAGEDMSAGTRVLTGGTRLGAAELGAAVAAGRGELMVATAPRVRIVCTGDELRAPGEPLGPGQIHNSNGPMLVALSRQAGALAPEAGTVGDDREATVDHLARALDVAHVVVVAGGVSVGPHDHVKPALEELGVREEFWRVALQPGKPTWFGTREGRLVFGLPGNPVSAYVTFTLFVAPALAALQGGPPAPLGQGVLGTAVRLNAQREQALRVRVQARESGLVAFPNGPQGSHIVTSLLGADALALIPPGSGEASEGTPVRLIPLPGERAMWGTAEAASIGAESTR